MITAVNTAIINPFKKSDLFKVKIDELRRQKKDLFGNQRNLEKFAREKYLMKKSNEDIFVIVDAEVNSDEKND